MREIKIVFTCPLLNEHNSLFNVYIDGENQGFVKRFSIDLKNEACETIDVERNFSYHIENYIDVTEVFDDFD